MKTKAFILHNKYLFNTNFSFGSALKSVMNINYEDQRVYHAKIFNQN